MRANITFPGPLVVAGLCATIAAAPAQAQQASADRDYRIQPVVASRVGVEDSFWSERLRVNRTVTIPFALRKCEETGRIENFKVAGGLSDGKWCTTNGYDDSDLSKVIEGAAYSLMTHPDEELEEALAQLASYYAAAQEEDGYLYTLWTARHTIDIHKVRVNPGDDRWGRIDYAHQLYNAGHMYEAGVAHWQATGDDELLEVCRKNADCIFANFGEGKIELPPGHQEIEIGLAKLYRATGDHRYLDLAKYFLDIRGRKTKSRERLYGTYSQDHQPVTEQREAVGHSVRAGYMYAGMADVAALTGDEAYINAIQRIWESTVHRRMYLTGGVGAAGGHEGFGADYELPNLSAYCETCAAIAMCFWNHRMFLMTGESRFMDVLERTLYNGVISGVSLDGELFFYPNPLESDGRHARSPWFSTSCCPSNICRFIPSVPGYAYATRDDDLYVNLYIAGDSELTLKSGKLAVRQNSKYPWHGRIELVLQPEATGQQATLRLRIPGWAVNDVFPGDLYEFAEPSDQQPSLAVNGKSVPLAVEQGYAVLSRVWKPGDTVVLDLPMPIRRVRAHEKIEDDRGKVALQRGPIVYCVEHPDVPGGSVTNLLLEDDSELEAAMRPDLLGGVTVITGDAVASKYLQVEGIRSVETAPVEFAAIPYYAWAHRGKGEMAVWLAREPDAVRPLPAPTYASRAKATASRGDVSALADQREPSHSNDHSNRFLHTWPRRDPAEWVQYDFQEATEVTAVEVYWFDDEPRGGGCRIPDSWQLFYRGEDEEWVEVGHPTAYGCDKDRYNRCEFDPVTTTGLRLEMKLQAKWSTGIHEWRVE